MFSHDEKCGMFMYKIVYYLLFEHKNLKVPLVFKVTFGACYCSRDDIDGTPRLLILFISNHQLHQIVVKQNKRKLHMMLLCRIYLYALVLEPIFVSLGCL